MTQAAISHKDLELAFEAFNKQSGLLEACYRSLQQRVEELSERLRVAQSARHRELLEKERLSNRLSSLLETLPGAFLVIDGDGVILERNNRAADLLSQPLIGCCWSDVVQREFCPNRRVDGDLCLRDGRWINLFRRPLEYGHGEILLLTDVTESRRMSEMLQCQDRLSAMGEMTATLAHQIRTPLSSALLYLSQLESDEDNGDKESGAKKNSAKKNSEIARKAAQYLRNLDGLVSDMLNFVGGVRRHGETIDVRSLLDEVFAAIEPQLGDGSYVTVDLQEDGLTVVGNREALQGALLNLVENALQACGDFPVVELSAARNDDEVCLIVTDNGHGLSEEARSKLFQPFYTTRPQGTGLGLAIVGSVAEAHGGSVEFDSGSHGSTFAICLPAEAPGVPAVDDEVSAGSPMPSSAQSECRHATA